MNERIRELALQANAHETGHAYYRGEKKPENAVTLHSVDLEKFAQLIVRECMSLADLPNNTTGQWDHLSPSEVIANYFGVES